MLVCRYRGQDSSDPAAETAIFTWTMQAHLNGVGMHAQCARNICEFSMPSLLMASRFYLFVIDERMCHRLEDSICIYIYIYIYVYVYIYIYYMMLHVDYE